MEIKLVQRGGGGEEEGDKHFVYLNDTLHTCWKLYSAVPTGLCIVHVGGWRAIPTK